MVINCTACGQRIMLPDDSPQTAANCPRCGQRLAIPADPSGAAEEQTYTCRACGADFAADDVYAEGDEYICIGCHGLQADTGLAAAATSSTRAARRRVAAPRPARSRRLIAFNIIATLLMTVGVIWYFTSDRNDLQAQIDQAEAAAAAAPFEVAAARFRDLSVRAAGGVPAGMAEKVQAALARWHELSQRHLGVLRREMVNLQPESACRLYPVLQRLSDENLLTEPLRPELDGMIAEVRDIFPKTYNQAVARADAGDLAGALPLFRRLYLIAQAGGYPPQATGTLQAAVRRWISLYESTVAAAEADLNRGHRAQARTQLQALVDDAANQVVPAEAADAIRKARLLLNRS